MTSRMRSTSRKQDSRNLTIRKIFTLSTKKKIKGMNISKAQDKAWKAQVQGSEVPDTNKTCLTVLVCMEEGPNAEILNCRLLLINCCFQWLQLSRDEILVWNKKFYQTLNKNWFSGSNSKNQKRLTHTRETILNSRTCLSLTWQTVSIITEVKRSFLALIDMARLSLASLLSAETHFPIMKDRI